MKKVKIYQFTKIGVDCALAVLTAVFHDEILRTLQYFIGALIIFHGLEEIIFNALKEKKHYDVHSLYLNAVEILLGVTLIAFWEHEKQTSHATICVVWATWSILRESRELTECTIRFKEKLSAIPNIIESLVVISLSCILLVYPTEEHASLHLHLLVAELLTSALCPLLDLIKIPRANRTDRTDRLQTLPEQIGERIAEPPAAETEIAATEVVADIVCAIDTKVSDPESPTTEESS